MSLKYLSNREQIFSQYMYYEFFPCRLNSSLQTSDLLLRLENHLSSMGSVLESLYKLNVHLKKFLHTLF